MTVLKQNPYELFQEEFPELAASFNDLVEAQKSQEGLDSKTKQLVNIAILTAHQNLDGVKLHAFIAKNGGATFDEITGGVVLNLHHSGLTSVLKCLPTVIDKFKGKLD